jgi:4-amino-4-deoxy-L-arabinose transferase-like glycosyltransferase
MGTATERPTRLRARRDVRTAAARWRSSRADRHDGSSRRRRWLVPLAASVLLGQMTVAMLLSSRDDAPTYDEPAHLAAGVGYLRFGQLRLNYEHPPLAKALAGVPLVLADLDLPDRATFAHTKQIKLGQQILYQRGNNPERVLLLARLPMMALALALAGAIFGFARDLFGAGAALVPLGFATLDPNLLGHGRLVTTDVAVALFLLLTVWAIWRAAARSPSWLIAAGVAFGLALSAKYTALLAGPIVAALVLLAVLARSAPMRRLRALGAGVVGLLLVAGLAVAVVWAVYLAIDSHLDFTASQARVSGLLPAITDRLPLPEPYRAGVRYVIYYDQFDRPAFLFGRSYRGGNLAFYPAMLAIKNPVVTLVAWAGAVAAILLGGRRRPGPEEAEPSRTDREVTAGMGGAEPEATAGPAGVDHEVVTSERDADRAGAGRSSERVRPGAAVRGRAGLAATLLLLPVWMFTLAMQSGTNIGYRHILVVPAFLNVATGALAGLRVRGRRIVVAVVALVFLAGVSTWRVYPSYLAYVSELFGGPNQGYRLIADSNLDWGQDLLRAARYVREKHPGEPIYLLYFGTAVPSAYGLDAVDLTKVPRRDLDALHGIVLASTSRLVLYDDPRFDEFRRREPIAQIGHSILVYQL